MDEILYQDEFTTYQQALEVKELGFDWPCFGYFYGESDITYPQTAFKKWYTGKEVLAPLRQQIFKWFRKKHNLRSFVDTRVTSAISLKPDGPSEWVYDFQIKMGNGIDTRPYYSGDYDSYEEAELACINKLIKLAKAAL